MKIEVTFRKANEGRARGSRAASLVLGLCLALVLLTIFGATVGNGWG